MACALLLTPEPSSVAGPGSELSTSVLGRRVQVGANVTIRDSHIWNDVVIEDCAVRE